MTLKVSQKSSWDLGDAFYISEFKWYEIHHLCPLVLHGSRGPQAHCCWPLGHSQLPGRTSWSFKYRELSREGGEFVEPQYTSTGAHDKLALTHRDRQALHGFCGFSSQRLKKRERFRRFRKLYECCTTSTNSSAGGQQIQESQMRAVPIVPSLLLLDQLQEATAAPSLPVPPQKFTSEELVCTRQWTPFLSLPLLLKL